MGACVIFNPAARGDRARRFQAVLRQLAARAVLRPTSGPGDALRLARDAATEGFAPIIAAGGDGTVFEVINGLAEVPGALENVGLGILPLGTANVLAHEIGMSVDPAAAWQALESAIPRRVDLGRAEFTDASGNPITRRFVVVAGAGLDARAVQLVAPRTKRRWGKMAYIAAALRAWARFPDQVHARIGGRTFVGRVVLAGNGRFYAGAIPVFEDGRLDSGSLHVRGVRRVTWAILARCLRAYLTCRWHLGDEIVAEAVRTARWEAENPVPLQLDGEFAGWLPASLEIEPGRLALLVPRTRHGA